MQHPRLLQAQTLSKAVVLLQQTGAEAPEVQIRQPQTALPQGQQSLTLR